MIETIPTIENEAGVNEDATLYAQNAIKGNVSISSFDIDIKEKIRRAYMRGATSGFAMGYRLAKMKYDK